MRVSSVIIFIGSLAAVITFIGYMKHKQNKYGEFIDKNIEHINDSTHSQTSLIPQKK
jgi:hypothetical protein